MGRLTERDGDQWSFAACNGCVKPHCNQCEMFREQAKRLAIFEDAMEQGQLVMLPVNHMQRRITDPHAKYNAHAINSECYAGFDGSCTMPHCSGCPIRSMYILMQDIENQAEAALKVHKEVRRE